MTQPFAPEPRAISPFAIGGSFGAVHGVQAVGYPAVGEIDIRLVRMATTGRRVITTAFRAGWAAGDRVNLNRPMPGAALRQLV